MHDDDTKKSADICVPLRLITCRNSAELRKLGLDERQKRTPVQSRKGGRE